MKTKNKKFIKRDLVLAVTLFIVLGGLFVFFRYFSFDEEAAYAHIFYGRGSDPIVSIDFARENVIVNREQENVEEFYFSYHGIASFPYVNKDEKTVTLLGDYTINGVRQVVVIRYDFVRRSMQIIKEQSPNNICSREGESTGWPLICIPNSIRVEFESGNQEDDHIV